MMGLANIIGNFQMKKLIFIMFLLPLTVFAEETANPNVYASNSNCSNLIDPTERKECLIIEKKSEATQNFKNFQENNQSPYKETF